MKIMVTGFEAFGGEEVNPSWLVVQQLPTTISGATIVKTLLPTTFEGSQEVLTKVIEEERPQVVLLLGQAGGRTALTPERVAINCQDASIPDNEGKQPIDTPVVLGGADAYFSTLPIKAMVSTMRAGGIPAEVSNTAGTFVCNHVMYYTLYLADTQYPQMRAGFLHLPFILEQVVKKPKFPSMDLCQMIKGVIMAIEVIVQHQEDIKAIGGAVC